MLRGFVVTFKILIVLLLNVSAKFLDLAVNVLSITQQTFSSLYRTLFDLDTNCVFKYIKKKFFTNIRIVV